MPSKTDQPLQAPLLHLNGSGYANLSQQYEAVLDALRTVDAALRAASPHGRDYYPLEAGTFERAREQHEARIERIHSVWSETVTLYHEINKQHNRRPRP